MTVPIAITETLEHIHRRYLSCTEIFTSASLAAILVSSFGCRDLSSAHYNGIPPPYGSSRTLSQIIPSSSVIVTTSLSTSGRNIFESPEAAVVPPDVERFGVDGFAELMTSCGIEQVLNRLVTAPDNNDDDKSAGFRCGSTESTCAAVTGCTLDCGDDGLSSLRWTGV